MSEHSNMVVVTPMGNCQLVLAEVQPSRWHVRVVGAESDRSLQTGWVPDTVPSDRQKNILLVSSTGVPLAGRVSPQSPTTEPPRFGTSQHISATYSESFGPRLCEILSLESREGFKFTGVQDPDTRRTVQSSPTHLLEPPDQLTHFTWANGDRMSQLSTLCTWEFLLALW